MMTGAPAPLLKSRQKKCAENPECHSQKMLLLEGSSSFCARALQVTEGTLRIEWDPAECLSSLPQRHKDQLMSRESFVVIHVGLD
jgi:hypothetical protein